MLLRPMLTLRRADLRAWLAARAEIWIDDPANEDPRFARTRVRTGGTFAAESASPRLESDVAALAALCDQVGNGALSLPQAALRGAPASAALHVLSTAALCAGGGATPPRRAEVERLLAWLIDAEGSARTLCGARITLRQGVVLFTREAGDRARRPRADIDGVVDGRFLLTQDGPAFLTHARFRAACFLIGREPPIGPSAALGRLPPRRALP